MQANTGFQCIDLPAVPAIAVNLSQLLQMDDLSATISLALRLCAGEACLSAVKGETGG